jgi:hypothetical protein
MKLWLMIGSALLILPLVLSCSSGYQLLSQATSTEANTLKSYCEQINLQSPDTKKADLLFTEANVMLQKRKLKEAHRKMDLVVIYYRLALSKSEMEQSKKLLQEASRQLNEDENQLNSYLEILQEMGKSGKK